MKRRSCTKLRLSSCATRRTVTVGDSITTRAGWTGEQSNDLINVCKARKRFHQKQFCEIWPLCQFLMSMLTNDYAVSPGPNQREGKKKEVNWAGKAQFKRRFFHEPNLIRIWVDPNPKNPAFWFRRRSYSAELNSIEANQVCQSAVNCGIPTWWT